MDNGVRCWCKHCGIELPPSHTGPCPKCGKSGKRCEASAHVTIGVVVSASAKKVHEYTQKHPWFISISIVLTIISLIVGYLLGALVGLLIGIIVAMLNWWITPYALKTIVEITHLGGTGKVTQETKTKNDAQPKSYSHKDIYNKLESIGHKVDSSSQIQKFGILYVLGAAFVILGLSLWSDFLQLIGIDTARGSINPIAFIILGFITMIAAYIVSRSRREVKKK